MSFGRCCLARMRRAKPALSERRRGEGNALADCGAGNLLRCDNLSGRGRETAMPAAQQRTSSRRNLGAPARGKARGWRALGCGDRALGCVVWSRGGAAGESMGRESSYKPATRADALKAGNFTLTRCKCSGAAVPRNCAGVKSLLVFLHARFGASARKVEGVLQYCCIIGGSSRNSRG